MKSLIFGIILALFAGIVSGAPTGGVITTTVRTNTTALVQVTTAPTAVDSVFICYFAGSSTDTTFAATADSTTTNQLLSSLNPGKRYIVFLLVRQGAGELTALSDKDTITVYPPEIETAPASNVLASISKLFTATSWKPTALTESFTLNGTSAVDSTGVIELFKNTSFLVKTSQAGDSTKVMGYIHYGYRQTTQTGSWVEYALKDSVNVSAPGGTLKVLSGHPPGAQCYIRWNSYAGNGKNTALEAYAIRERY